MKRRDFITGAMGAVGGLLPVLGRAQGLPCPPGSVAVDGGPTVTTECSPNTTLAQAAAAMSVGQWLLVHSGGSKGFTSSLLSANSDSILNYAVAALRNPNAKEIHFLGAGHLAIWKHIKFSEANDRWSLVTESPSFAPPGSYNHGYKHSALDSNGDIYWRNFNSSDFFKWNGSSWQRMANVPRRPNDIATAMEWHPGFSRVVYCATDQIFAYDPAENSWSSPLATISGLGGYHNQAVYCSAQDVVLMGGGEGSRRLWKVSKSGAVTAIADAPVEINIFGALLTYDPASGTPLLFPGGNTAYRYDFQSNEWTSFSRGGSWSGLDYTAFVPLYDLSRVMMIRDRSPEVWLYRHA